MDTYLQFLSSLSLFKGMSLKDIEDALQKLESRVVHKDKNEIVIHEGDPAIYIGILLRGQLQIARFDYHGNRHIIHSVDAGQMFGESYACSTMKEMPLEVLAVQDSDVLLIDATKLSSLGPSIFFQNLVSMIASMNVGLNRKMEIITKKTTQEKVLAYLEREAIAQGSNHITIPFNRQELADYLSVERSALSFVLSTLKKKGVIDFHKNRFTLR